MKTQASNIDAHDALLILKDFSAECRKEFRKLLNVNTRDEISSLHFICTGFNLYMIVKEGGAV